MILTLGSMMDNLKRWDLTEATRIIRRIEDRLGVHGRAKMIFIFIKLSLIYRIKNNGKYRLSYWLNQVKCRIN